jgi:hypothetical protein
MQNLQMYVNKIKNTNHAKLTINFQTAPIETNPCNPSPCGQNSQCREINGQAVCSCLPGYTGSAPYCRPECVISSDCSLQKSCMNYKCIDPCSGYCGINALCKVINHNPVCTCPRGQTGDPNNRCFEIGKLEFLGLISTSTIMTKKNLVAKPPPYVSNEYINPCNPSPCGPNSVCKNENENAKCQCLPEFIGAPPNCRPECSFHSECSENLACIKNKCSDPCINTCGSKSLCHVAHHLPICSCPSGMTGDPFSYCYTHDGNFIDQFIL